MFDSMKDDISRNGLVSNILKRLADFEAFMRNHQTVNHGIKDFVDVTAWTPVVAGSTIAGTGTYTTQVGRYSRIGKVIYFTINLAWTAHTGTGDLTVTGLPIANNSAAYSTFTVYYNGLTLAAVGNKAMAYVSPSASTIIFQEVANGASSLIPMDAAVSFLMISGFYFVD